MQKWIPFDSRNERYKKPFGAAAEGEPIHFSVNMPRSIGCTGVTLVLHEDGSDRAFYYSLFWRETDSVTEWWECDAALPAAGLYWYYFEYSVSWGNGRIYLDRDGKGCFSGSQDEWQLTIYQKDFTVPDWLKGGVIYQIFPDRFYTSEKKKTGIPHDRILRRDREGIPVWQPDEKGVIRNNDYFCGDLKGIEEKLPYIKSLGVTCIYLNPIFEAHSNHRYDTADYEKIDPLLGTREDFCSLCKKAEKMGISVIFDGVFSHTGADSVYFNKYRRYGSGGAYNDPDSPYRCWYSFGKTRDEYASWWGIDTLPEVNENEPSFTEFITGEGGVIDTWLNAGARGVRLDVADELPDAFLDKIRERVKKNGRDAYLLGEVWEDATNKISWGSRRRYLLGRQLDSVMNYPFREAILDFIRFGDAENFMNRILEIVENYPPPALHTAMNHLGTHDTERILTALSGKLLPEMDRSQQAQLSLTEQERQEALVRVRAAAVLQYTLPGVPSLYYGDEAAMQGAKDPFNRGAYPWGRADKEMVEFFRGLGALRREHPVFREGAFRPLSAAMQCAAFVRECETERIAVIANRNDHEITYYFHDSEKPCRPLLFCQTGENCAVIPPFSTAVVLLK